MTTSTLNASLDRDIPSKKEASANIATDNARTLTVTGGTAPYTVEVKKQFVGPNRIVVTPRPGRDGVYGVHFTFPPFAGVTYRGQLEVRDSASGVAHVDIVCATTEAAGRLALPTGGEWDAGNLSVTEADWPVIAELSFQQEGSRKAVQGRLDMTLRYNRNSQRIILYGLHTHARDASARETASRFSHVFSCDVAENDLQTALRNDAWRGFDVLENLSVIRDAIPAYRL